jgi:hypothetical protein
MRRWRRVRKTERLETKDERQETKDKRLKEARLED